MPRLDYAMFGRSLEHLDKGFISYVNFINLEVNQSHPVKIAFCEILIDLIKFKQDNGLIIDRRKQIAKTRWYLAITLAQNIYLYKYRKAYILKWRRRLINKESILEYS